MSALQTSLLIPVAPSVPSLFLTLLLLFSLMLSRPIVSGSALHSSSYLSLTNIHMPGSYVVPQTLLPAGSCP